MPVSVSIWKDPKSRCYFARWRERKADGTVKFHAQRLVPYDADRYRTTADVKKSPEYLAVVQQLVNGDADSNHSRLLLAVAKARGKPRPDSADRASVERFTSDDAANAMLLSTFVEKVYFPDAEKTLRDSTFQGYKSMWNRYHIADKVAGLRVQDFETPHGYKILESIVAENNPCRSTLKHVKFMLSSVFVLALKEGVRKGTNPMTEVDMKKLEGRKSGETKAYTLDQILAMLRLPFDAATKAAIGIAAFAGLRESEITGLRWMDYDGEEITVRRSIDRIHGTANPPKTLKSAAPVPVIPSLKRLLDAHKANVSLGPDGQPMPDAPIFTGTRRETANLDKMALRVIRPALESAEIPWFGWHAFRRGLASNLFQLGCDDMTVQRILRHSKVQVTREAYIKVRDEKVESAMAQLDAVIESKNHQTVQ